MNVSKIKGLIPVVVSYPYLDSDGNACEGEVNIKVRKLSLKEADSDEIKALLNGEDNSAKKQAEFLCTVIAEWDLTADDAGTPFDLSADNLIDLPFDFLMRLIEASVGKFFSVISTTKPKDSDNG